MTARIDIRVDDAALQEALRRLLEAGEAMAPVMPAIAAHLASSVEESFELEASDDTIWPPLKPATVRQRQRKGYGGEHPKLQRSGALIRSILSQVDETSATVGSGLIYAATHQFGADERNIPARPFLALHDWHRDAIVDEIRRHQHPDIGRAGLRRRTRRGFPGPVSCAGDPH